MIKLLSKNVNIETHAAFFSLAQAKLLKGYIGGEHYRSTFLVPLLVISILF